MAAMDILPAEGEWFDETLAQASPDMLREMVVRMAQMMMEVEVEQRCGAGYGEVSEAFAPHRWTSLSECVRSLGGDR